MRSCVEGEDQTRPRPGTRKDAQLISADLHRFPEMSKAPEAPEYQLDSA